MGTSSLSYFSCTLSEALDHNVNRGAQIELTERGVVVSHKQFQDINGYVDFLASQYGNRLAVGCTMPIVTHDSDKHRSQESLLTFTDIRRSSIQVGKCLEKLLRQHRHQSEWVALLATASPLFLLVWLGLIRYGYKVLLIAPQSSSQTTRHLIRLSGATTIVHDDRYLGNAEEAVGGNADVDSAETASDTGAEPRPGLLKIPWASMGEVLAINDVQEGDRGDDWPQYHGSATDVAYSFHSSGTTGLPKLIPQTHHGAVGVLPLLQELTSEDEYIRATFTTTPLYSGGVADIFRSWSAAAPLWLFPEGQLPITGQNILGCIERIDQICQEVVEHPSTRLKYVSCVPFVLESIMHCPNAMKRMCDMEMVGVGGAAMMKHLGDELVAKGVPLISRFGSSENGFLLSSSRDFVNDKEWNVLRSKGISGLIFQKFEGSDDGFELVVSSAWPLVSTASHAQRPFNTHDVLSPHPVLRHAWVYRGRSDAQLTLRTGRKFSPAEMEALLKANVNIEEVVVIGEGQVMPAAVVFMADIGHPRVSSESVQKVKRAIAEANFKVATHARLSQPYIKMLAFGNISRIPKNNKGEVLRSLFAKEFAAEIDEIYDGVGDGHSSTIQVDMKSPEAVLAAVGAIINRQLQLPEELGVDEDLFEAGLDSQGCISICRQLINSTGVKKLHIGTVYECGTIRKLADHISDTYLSINLKTTVSSSKSTKEEEMLRMVQQYVGTPSGLLEHLRTSNGQSELLSTSHNSKTFVLTGATGFLGVHLLYSLLKDEDVDRIFLLIRGSQSKSCDEQHRTAQLRIEASLSRHQLNDPDAMVTFKSKTVFVPFFIKEDDLGLTTAVRTDIASSVTHIIHSAWEVNFNLPLKTFSDHIKGAVTLFNLATLAAQHRHCRVSYIFCSSIASISNVSRVDLHSLQHTISNHSSDAASLGYAQSKWVAEKVLHQLSQSQQDVHISILRVGQLTADAITGIWNRREAWPLMIDASLTIVSRGIERDHNHDHKSTWSKRIVFPDLARTHAGPIDWIPVNHAAARILTLELPRSPSENTVSVRSIVNDTGESDWATVQRYIEQWSVTNGYTFDLIPARVWLDILERSRLDHQAKALIPLWRKNWTVDDDDDDDGAATPSTAQESTSESATSRQVDLSDAKGSDTKAGYVLDAEYFEKMLAWIVGEKS